jgi:hypothetical protein
MSITETKFNPAPKAARSKRNTLFQMRRKIIFQHDPTGDVDELGARPYTNYEDYITGHDGNGVWADIDTPHPDDILMAAQHGMVLTHSILVRYDSRIDPRQIIKYTNWKTGEKQYWYIRTMIRPDWEYHYLRLGAEQIVEFGADE